MFRKAISILLILSMPSCALRGVKRETRSPAEMRWFDRARIEELRTASPYLKAHMKSGDAYVLQSWDVDKQLGKVNGTGVLLGPARDTISSGAFSVGFDSVAVFETNTLKTSAMTGLLVVLVGATAALTIYCATTPKACFGSCPTFYLPSADTLRLAAEGFSSSIAPSLEAADVDALCRTARGGDELRLEMRNEALETHVVRHADLIAVPVSPGARVFADAAGAFRECGEPVPPVAARGPEGDCLALVDRRDGAERFSLADSTYLGAKEELEIEFDRAPAGQAALVIGCRQTLLSTYLLYQAYAYMGREAGHWIARIERGEIDLGSDPIQSLMGGIEVSVRDGGGEWRSAGELKEYGPLATDVHLVPLDELAGGRAAVRLRMTKGNWRIDHLALVKTGDEASGVRVHPVAVLKDGREDADARAALLDSSRTLVTMPGDTYELLYALPRGAGSYELFLESRGYYFEWIRSEWIAEENPALLAQLLMNPRAALARLAPEFKRVEAGMEECFWRSRYAR